MSNRIYLYCTNFQSLPKPDEWENFFRQSGIEYEAKASIPIFWLCLFSSSNIRMVQPNHNGFDDDWRSYPYLMCSRKSGLDRLKERAPMMQKALGELRFALYTEWLQRIEHEPYENILVRTEELDWLGNEGELEGSLRKALKHLEQVCAEGSMRMSNAMNDISGLWSDEVLNECESSELVGISNESNSWPQRFEPLPIRMQDVPKKHPWWAFWR